MPKVFFLFCFFILHLIYSPCLFSSSDCISGERDGDTMRGAKDAQIVQLNVTALLLDVTSRILILFLNIFKKKIAIKKCFVNTSV